jgi:hypothetical protein
VADVLTRRAHLALAIQHMPLPIRARDLAAANAHAGFGAARNTARLDARWLTAHGHLLALPGPGNRTYTRTETTPMPIPFEVANHVLFHANRGGYPAGSFTTKLLDAWNLADPGNNARLTVAFPEYGAALALLGKPGGVDELRRIAGGDAG